MADLGCGEGRHIIAAAELGCQVVGIDRDPVVLAVARRQAAAAGLPVRWLELDLEGEWPALGVFDAVLVFNYLDRANMPRILQLVAPGGLLIMTLRHGPVPTGRIMFAVSAQETIGLAAEQGLRLVLNVHAESSQAANRDVGVSWTQLAFRRA